MTGTELAEALRSLARLVEKQRRVTGLKLEPLPGVVVSVRSSGAVRQANWRRNNPSRGDAKQTLGERLERVTSNATASVSGAVSSSPVPSVPPGPPSDSLSPSDLPKAAAAAAEGPVKNRAEKLSGAAPISDGLPNGGDVNDSAGFSAKYGDLPNATRDWSKSPPKSLDDAREMPLEERCRHVLERPDRAQWIQPEQWPEVRLAASAFREAVKRPRMPLGRFDSDAGVKRLVELYAAGLTAEEVCGAIPAVVSSAWFRSDPPKDLGSLTLTVVRRALDAQPAAQTLGGLPRPMFGGES